MVADEGNMVGAKVIFAVAVVNLLFLLGEVAMNIVRVYFG
jgi:hypothetical protein